jgi:hypothetical protein
MDFKHKVQLANINPFIQPMYGKTFTPHGCSSKLTLYTNTSPIFGPLMQYEGRLSTSNNEMF